MTEIMFSYSLYYVRIKYVKKFYFVEIFPDNFNDEFKLLLFLFQHQQQTNVSPLKHVQSVNIRSPDSYLPEHVSELQVVLKEASRVHQPLVPGQLQHRQVIGSELDARCAGNEPAARLRRPSDLLCSSCVAVFRSQLQTGNLY